MLPKALTFRPLTLYPYGMKVVALYHPRSDHGGLVTDYAVEFERYKRKKLELFSLETVEGANLAELYGVSQYPCILAVSDNGSLLRLWQGLPLPLMDELSYYVPDTPSVAARQARMVAVPAKT